MQDSYPRDLVGYGRDVPDARWPGRARICLQFVVNYEEGAENCILHGDAASECFLSEIIGAEPWPGQRHMNMESIYEYGPRAGFWRLRHLFVERAIPVTVFAVAQAIARNPQVVAAMQEAGWEIASHGLKWIDYRNVAPHDERAQIGRAIELHKEVTGERPLGFYQGRTSEQTLALAMEEGGFLYCADSYADDLPYWVEGARGPQLIVPYTLDANDMRFAVAQGFNSGDQFFAYLKDSFDLLYGEGATRPKMLSVGLHCRLAGRPGRAAALARFLDYAQSHTDVWFATRLAVARHWIARHPPAAGWRPSHLPSALFCELFGGIFEHSPWVAETAYDRGLPADADSAEGLWRAMQVCVEAAPDERKQALIDAHPDLSGRLAKAKLLTADSAAEQASAGLDRLTPDALARFSALNAAYKAKFGFVFIMAVRGRSQQDILAAFESRLGHSRDQEFRTAIEEIGKIARGRLREILPAGGERPS